MRLRSAIAMMFLFTFTTGIATIFAQQPAPGRETIGSVLGKTIYRDELVIPKGLSNIPIKIRDNKVAESAAADALPANTLEEILIKVENSDSSETEITFEGEFDDEEMSDVDLAEADESEDREDFVVSGEVEYDESDISDKDETDEDDSRCDPEADKSEEDSKSEPEEYDESQYYDDMSAEEKIDELEQTVQNEVFRLFVRPLMSRYSEDNKAQIEPSSAEIREFTANLVANAQKDRERRRQEIKEIDEKLEKLDPSKAGARKELLYKKKFAEQLLKMPEPKEKDYELFARGMIQTWKLNVLLYENYGKGRVLYQQAGMEAFDAMRQFLDEQQKLGRLEITDPALRQSLQNYWTHPGHSSFLKEDPETINKFMIPFWKR